MGKRKGTKDVSEVEMINTADSRLFAQQNRSGTADNNEEGFA